MSTLLCDPLPAPKTITQIVDELAFRNYVYNRVELKMPAELYARYSTNGPKFEARLLASAEGAGL